MRLKIAIFASFSLASIVLAAPLTLEEALMIAKTQSPTLQKARAVLQEKQYKTQWLYGTSVAPKLTASSTYFFEHQYQVLDMTLAGQSVSFATIYPTTVYGLKAQLPLFNEVARPLIDASKLYEQAAQQDLDQTIFKLEEEVRLAFYQALTAQKMAEVTQLHQKTLEDHAQQTQIQKNHGRATQYDMLHVQVQLSQVQLDVSEAQDAVENSHQHLFQLLGLSEDRSLSGELPTPRPDSVQSLEFNNSARADLKSADKHLQALSKTQESNTPWYLPQVSLVGAYELYNNRNDSPLNADFRAAYQAGIFASWELIDGGVSIAQTHILEAQKLQTLQTMATLKLESWENFSKYKRAYLNHSRRFIAKKLDIQRAEEGLRLVRLEAQEGTRTNTEVLDAELDVFRSKSGLVLAQMQAVEALIYLETALGRRL